MLPPENGTTSWTTSAEDDESHWEKVQDLARFKVPPGFRERSAALCQLWWIVQGTLFAASPQFAFAFRRFLLRLFGARIGRNALIRPSVRITYPWKVSIGDRAWIGDHAELYSLGRITIGNDAVISQLCYLCTGGHDPGLSDFPIFSKPIEIQAEAWLCADVFVMPGITVGRGAVVGARSLVTADVPPMAMARGHPASIVGVRKRSAKVPSVGDTRSARH